jgi:hypothetical protein
MLALLIGGTLLFLASAGMGIYLLVAGDSTGAELRRAPKAAGAFPGGNVGSLRDRLVGTWDIDLPGGGKASLEFRPDGDLVVTATVPRGGGMQTVQQTGRWEVVSEAAGRLKVRRILFGKPEHVDDFTFLGNDRLRIAEAVYQRRR